MLDYQKLDWPTLHFFERYLQRHFDHPLHETIAHLERAQLISNGSLHSHGLSESQHTLERLVNLIQAWRALIAHKEHEPILFKDFLADTIPSWFHHALEKQTSFRIDFTHTIQVHLESFLEATLLLYELAAAIRKVACVQIVDAPSNKPGVYIRIVLAAEIDQLPLGSLGDLEVRFHQDDPQEWGYAVQFAVARDMLLLNHGYLTLQNNKKTGQQALATYFLPKETPVAFPSLPIPELRDSGQTPEAKPRKTNLNIPLGQLSEEIIPGESRIDQAASVPEKQHDH